MRLNQYLAACGFGSRRACEALIVAGRVRVNDAPPHFGTRVSSSDRVTVDDQIVRPPATTTVWMLHKPAGVVTTRTDPERRPTVFDLVRQAGITERFFAVGRLDCHTTGLLLLTNDGDLGFRITHPSFGIEKEYEAWVAEPLTADTLAQLEGGVALQDGITAPCRVAQEVLAHGVRLRLVLHEGRKRQVRRMLNHIGHPVGTLHRLRIGPLELHGLPCGQLRRLEDSERALLERCLAATASERPAVERSS